MSNIEEQIELTNLGLWWRKNDRSYKYLSAETDIPKTVSNQCQQKRVVVQAGGHCGMFVKLYSEIFDVVYTFEPDPINFYCLTKNVDNANVIKIQGCVGDEKKFISLETNKKTAANSGAYSVGGSGIIPTFNIDDLNLEICDLIHLDIEGFEILALKGALTTIKKCWPVIALEFRNFGVKYGYSDEEVKTFLKDLGYKEEHQIHNDIIFKKYHG